MDFTERQIEDLIFENLNPVGLQILCEKGLNLTEYAIFERQVNLGSYGRLDLLGINYMPLEDVKGFRKKIKIGIIEIKKEEINIQTYMQACRYATAIKHYFNLRNLDAEICIHLIGTSANLNELYHLINVDNLNVHILRLDIVKGISFKTYDRERYLINHNLNINKDVEKRVKKFLKDRLKDKVAYIHHEKNLENGI